MQSLSAGLTRRSRSARIFFSTIGRIASLAVLLFGWDSCARSQEASLLQTWRPTQLRVFDGKLIEGREKPENDRAASGQVATAELAGPPNFDEDGLLQFSSGQLLVVADGKKRLPSGSFSVEAWVRVDKPHRWGAIFGFQQDNGSYERGWSLGYHGDRFEFRVSDGAKLINCTAGNSMKLGGWHHVVGVCDARRGELVLYVDGQRQTAIAFQADGPVYPEEDLATELVIGAYKDKDERFPMVGRIREVRLYAHRLSEETIAAHVQWQENLPEKSLKFAVRPGVRFLTPTSAEFTWETTIAGESMVAIGESRKLNRIVGSKDRGTRHRVVVDELVPGRHYFYRFGVRNGSKRRLSGFYELDAGMNYMPPVVTSSGLPPGGQAVLDRIDGRGGYAVVMGDASPSWAEAIASVTTMTVVAASRDAESVQQWRKKWYQEQRYGIRMTAQLRDELPSRFANLVIGTGEELETAGGLLTPNGALICIGPPSEIPADVEWTEMPKNIWWGQPASQQELSAWGHQYGSAANTSFVGEQLGGVDRTSDLKVQWLGRPGADFGIDRNPRMPAPLAIGGRLFHQGMNRMIALDAFNGAVLWSLEIPDLRRVNIPRDCANWCADQERVFAAVKDRLWVIDASSGEMLTAFHLPANYRSDHQWGFIADGGDRLIATAAKQSSSYESFWDKASWYDGKDDEATAKVCGSAVVAYDKKYGDVLWEHPADAVVHSTITIAGNRVYFVQVDDPKLRAIASGKLTNRQIWSNASVVCLDIGSGEQLWKKKVPPQDDAVVVSFGLAGEGQYILETSSSGKFHFVSLDAASGTPRWSRSIRWPEDHHGAHMQHAVLMNGRIFIQPHILNATDGSVLESGTLGKRRGCATPIGAGGSIIFRGGSGPLSLWSLDGKSRSEFTRLRPSCWLSTIPAQGMLFSPEGGGGCSCGGWMETSIGFAPISKSEGK